jgi:hypothetical protein
MTIITKGMGAIIKKGGDLLKKSKKFPGPKSDMLLNRKVRQRLRPKGDPHPKSGFKKQTKVPGVKGKIGAHDIDVHARIGRTQRYRNLAASRLRQHRNPEKYKSPNMPAGDAKHSGGTFSKADYKKIRKNRKARGITK